MTTDNDDFRDWRFEPNTKEIALERRVRELEEQVSRLEKQLRLIKHTKDYDYVAWNNERNISDKSIGAVAGTLGGVLPQSPYKAD